MKAILTTAASAVLIFSSLPAAQAGWTNHTQAFNAKQTMGQVDALASRIADIAFELNRRAKDDVPEIQLEGLYHLKDAINKVGADIAALKTEQSSLSPAEARALDEAIPRMQQVAADTDQAFRFFNTDRDRLWTTPFVSETADISAKAREVASVVHDTLKVEGYRAKAANLNQKLGESGSE